MRTKPYVIVSAGLAAGVLTFVVSLFFVSHTMEPLPPQAALPTEHDAVASSAAHPTTTTAPASDILGARALEPPLDPIEQRSLPSAVRPLDAACEDPTVVKPPASDLAAVVAAAEPFTCFLLEAGEYRFHSVVPKDHMTFLGVSREAVRVVGTAETENAFHGTATGVTIGRMMLTGFQGTGGEKRQEQGAIRGTAGLWKSDRGEMASEWLIEDIEASNNFATGVFLGDHFTVRGSRLHANGVTGLAGSETVGGLVELNVVSDNGEHQATGYLANGAGMKFTQAISPEDPLVIRRNEIHGNAGIGVWCDIACNGFEVSENYIHDQESRAVMFELSSNAVIRGNLLVNTNTWSNYTRDFNASAITVGESSDVLIEGNYVDGAVSGVVVRQTRRPVLPEESFLSNYENVTYLSQRVTVRDNIMVNTEAMGISTGSTGRGLIPDLASIRFERNTYANPGSLTFWWEGDSTFSFNDWQASGRDLGGSTSVPPRPAWSRTP